MKRAPAMDRTQIDPTPAGEGATAPLPALTPGLRVEQYELIRELGRGGMGTVYLARDTRLGRRVAMKFLTIDSKAMTDRFLVEARTTAEVSHENIVVIHDVAEYQGRPYMVLEYLDGAPLATQMRKKRMPFARAIELIVPVVRALVRAHAANIVHRDLKPENVMVTSTGTAKVLDFGIAQLVGNKDGRVAGTLPYMSPEQLGTDEVDHRSDLWAVGIILFELIAGRHPLDPVTQAVLLGAAAAPDKAMPSLADDVPGLPSELVAVVAKCLAKKKADRYARAADLLADLEPLLPTYRRQIAGDENPYPGLTAFQESDAGRFFGRAQDIAGMIARLREQPLIGLVGPSGVGKSSFIRAGVVPALKHSGESWEAMIVRPGRQPLAALAQALQAMRDTRDSDPLLDDEDLANKLRAEPGTLGTRLRSRARKKRTQILVFVDQHEELYTLVGDPQERKAFTACLTAAGDDPSGPIRVVIAMRSDFLDRAAEDRRLVDELTRGLVFLQPPNRAGLEAALVQPLAMVGYRFEQGVVPAMLSELEAAPGSLPLLQFTAAKLWEYRDREQQVLTNASYLAMGGVAGALATHADEVLARFPPSDQRVVRAIFQRLVTPERTRAIVDASELANISPDIERILGMLVAARLLVVQQRGREAAFEIVHESLIKSWPTLRRWLDENQEDSAYLAQLATAARQWDGKGRPEGMLWRNDAMEEARLWRARYRGELPRRDQEFIDEVIELGTRAQRTRRRAVMAGFIVMAALVAAAGFALVMIQQAKQQAVDNEHAAQRAQKSAEDATQLANRKTEELAKQIEQNAQQQETIGQQDTQIVQTQQEAKDNAAKAEQAKLLEQAAKNRAAAEEKKRLKAEEDAKAAKASKRGHGKIGGDNLN
ncbi:MAG TPA: protein kinase [Kofleriaceae bacterium]|jgi:hypothetical protein